jgi:hypothetical protein
VIHELTYNDRPIYQQIEVLIVLKNIVGNNIVMLYFGPFNTGDFGINLFIAFLMFSPYIRGKSF